MMKSLRLFIVTLFTVFLFSCASSQTKESTGEYLDSTAITSKVKASLLDNLGTKAFSIKVKTFKDQVQLSGFVDKPATRDKAERVTRRVANVKKVINNIVVK